MLEKEFVPYEESLALKELGFDEPCFGYWKSKNWIIQEKTRTDGYTHADQECSAPTFSQAFRWFRNKHNLNPLIAFCEYAIESENAWKYTLDNPTKILMWDGKFNTYEESELACLKKLIEISKNK